MDLGFLRISYEFCFGNCRITINYHVSPRKDLRCPMNLVEEHAVDQCLCLRRGSGDSRPYNRPALGVAARECLETRRVPWLCWRSFVGRNCRCFFPECVAKGFSFIVEVWGLDCVRLACCRAVLVEASAGFCQSYLIWG